MRLFSSTRRRFDGYGFVLRQLQRAAAESDVRRFMEGEDQLLRDAISWGKQADYERGGQTGGSMRSPGPSGSLAASGRSRAPSP
ncbi:MAG: hypothetical protein F4137_12570 [Acidobacteria bacterium]|nr:hypothetical protein [Acidobacteriota bacterium]